MSDRARSAKLWNVQPAGLGKRTAPPRWRMSALLRIGDFALIRRRLGRARSDRWAEKAVSFIRIAVPGVRAVVVARDLIEVGVEANARAILDAELEKLTALFASPFEIDGEEHAVNMLFGAVVTSDPAVDEVDMMERAEQTLHRAETERRVIVCDADAVAVDEDPAAFVRDLERAIAHDELFLHYQPKMDMRRQEITSVEALVRWRHPVRGVLSPADFIASAEQTAAINDLTLWTIRRALKDQQALARLGYDFRVFVNISGVVLGDGRFVESACALVEGRADRIGFEVTETSVIRDPDIAIGHLTSLAALGVAISIDDYGAGLSSLVYLKRLPARELKIDKLFVTQLTRSNRDPLIVRSTIDLAHALGMNVVAEGVESQATLALLSVMGCDIAQGFLICRPMSLNALTWFLDAGYGIRAVEESRVSLSDLAASWKRR